jgi:flagella basal body P-ring formation protein FlgA
MKTILIVIASTVLAHAVCITVSSPRIVAGDLVEAVPLLRSLDPATPLGFAPLPGTERIFTGRQLLLTLRRYFVNSDSRAVIPDVCVEREAFSISSADVKEALISALGIADANIDLIDFSRQPLPSGHLEFHREDLSKPPVSAPNTPVIWRGKLVYDGQQSASIWAKVRVSVERTWFVAAEDIPASAVIRADQVWTITGPQFPDLGPFLASPDSIVGKVARQGIPARHRFAPSMLSDVPDVQKGGRVHVKVMEGLAWLSLDAVAQSSGGRGETILLHNPLSGRNFRAVVTGKDEAMAQSSSGV